MGRTTLPLPVVATCLGILALAVIVCTSSTGRDGTSPEFDGVTATFTLTRARIRSDQQLEVHAIFRNTASATRTFGFLDFGVSARLYSKGELLENCSGGEEYPLQLVTLKPGETFEVTDEVFTTLCSHLAPGLYSIRFNYDLRAFQEDSLREQYEKQYNHPPDHIVPWDGRDHPFRVVRW